MARVSNSRFRHVIEEHFDSVDLDVICRKRKNAYAIHWAEDHEPLAKLRPTGQDDEVEVFYWQDDRWKQVAEFGLVLPLEESLEYITNDPENLFFDADERGDSGVSVASPELIAAVRSLHRQVFLCAVCGGAAGGAFSGWGSGGISAALAGTLFSAGLGSIRGNLRPVVPYAVFVGIPVLLFAGAGGVLGGSVNGAVSHSVWGPFWGVLTGALASLLIFGGLPAWGIGFATGLTLAASFVEVWQLRDQFVGLALVALAASLSARFYSSLARQHLNTVMPIMTSRDRAE